MFAWQSIATVEAILTQLCLNAIEDFLIDDCLVLSLVKIGLVLDLSTVSFMASMGLGMCIACRNQAAAVGATPLLFGLNKDLQALMAMMKIEKLFRIIKTQAELQQICSK